MCDTPVLAIVSRGIVTPGFEDERQREKNALVAYTLLPIFESTPEGWNAVQKFPTSSGCLADYLVDWHHSVDPGDKDFVTRVSNAFDYKIPS